MAKNVFSAPRLPTAPAICWIRKGTKSAYERAAAINGQTVSQWTLTNLDAAAERDIAAARTLYLTDEAFAQICDMLDKPVPEELQELIDREPLWV